MSTALKISTAVIGLLLLLGLITILFIPRLVDTNIVHQQLVTQVKQQTGLELSIDGELSLSVFPWLGIVLQDIRLAQPHYIDHVDPILAVGQAAIRVRLLPLLKKTITVDRIIMQSPSITYVIGKEGRTSLDVLSQAKRSSNHDKSQQRGEPQSVVNSDKTANSAALFSIAGIDITDGRLTYEDQSQGLTQRIEQLNIRSGNLLSRNGAPVELSATVSGDDFAPIKVRLKTKGDINIEEQSATLKDTNFSLRNEKNHAEASIDKIEFSPLLQLVTASQINLETNYKGLAPTLSISSMTWDLSQQQMSPFTFSATEESLALTVEGELMVKDLDTIPMAKGSISSSTFNPLKIVNALDMDYRPVEPRVLKTASFSTEFSAGISGAALSQLEINLDQSRLQGNFSIIMNNQTAYRFDLGLNEINIDHYLPISEEKNATDNIHKSTANADLALVVPIALLKGLNAGGSFRANAIQTNGARLSDIDLSIRSTTNGMKVISTANLYGGSLEGRMDLITKPTDDNLNIKATLSAINLEALLSDMGISDQFSGITDIAMDISVAEKNDQQSHAGTVQFSAKDGQLKNINVKKILDETQITIDRLRGKQREISEYKEDGTQFAEARGTFLINNNVITNDDLSIKAPAFRVTGKGIVDLAKGNINYTSSMTVVNTNQGQGGKDRSDLKGLVIPVRFYGLLTEPEYKIDTNAVIKANSEQELEKQKQALKQKAAQKLGLEPEDDEKTVSTKDLKDEIKKELLKKLFK